MEVQKTILSLLGKINELGNLQLAEIEYQDLCQHANLAPTAAQKTVFHCLCYRIVPTEQ